MVLERATLHSNVSSPYLNSGNLLWIIKNIRVLLIDLSKAFDCLSYELLLAKSHAYGFSIPTLRLVYNFLKNRK